MKKAFLILLSIVYTNAWAGLEKDAYQKYSVSKRMTSNVTVTIRTVPKAQVQQACDQESKRLGNGGMGYKVDACTFWWPKDNGYICTMILPEETNNDTIGHEFRHCFQGAFH